MKLLSLVFILIFPTLINCQEIDSVLFQKTWLDQETRVINGYEVTKDFGQFNRNPAAYNFYPITAVSFKDFNQLKGQLELEATENNWSDEKLRQEIILLQDIATGGELQIYISRYEENQANFRWYFIIIRGEDNEGKLWEKEIGYQSPENPFERGWWNYTTLNIPIKLEAPFYIYLNNKNSEFLSDFRFHVEKLDNTKLPCD